ncbi:hypothetical protein TPHA_0C02730 [Tetrapisispora phaffii CBS 4417]|uniref:Peroxisome assembly protein 12 n=1 Tax=Tetrapisispora phaffii (strain ATCC 24235 / CBS 4417 / NBRC 1672 / NRRL Y-8282 / UCD 70-5) TaxID=1071381 RepID=G8BRQ0_TETPH|nr:hypothetical protein TPHA_0C02730 [Tetrapisispora phaffii CBS 4417]CCE62426.1 hypothetical protein TPHA_0C02730 [Tetrapisispora phaffii CBS 4417]
MSFYSNLPSIQNNDSSNSVYPTIYEPISSSEIDELVPYSVRYILTNYWITRYPNWYTLQVNNYFDEWFNLGLKGLIEWHHIDKYNSTFIDKFYGLQRFNAENKVLLKSHVKDNSIDKKWPLGLQLTKLQKRALFIEQIVFPYFRTKLDHYHDTLTHLVIQNEEGTEMVPGLSKYMKVLFRKFYPIIKRCFQIFNLLIKLKFLAGKTGSLSLIDYLFNIAYSRALFPLESKNRSLTQNIGRHNRERLQRQNYYKFRSNFNENFTDTLSVLSYLGTKVFPTFLFTLRIYQWWTAENISSKIERKLNNIDRAIPRPPLTESNLQQNRKSADKCPVCKDKIQNPCVIETGYVMCYPCALDYITQHEGRCPVTNKKLLGCKYNSLTKNWNIVNGIRRLII